MNHLMSHAGPEVPRVALRPVSGLVYADMALGDGGEEGCVTYRVHNPCARPVHETVQIYVEITYADGCVRRRMVGWEVHDLKPDEARHVCIGPCGFDFPAADQPPVPQAALKVLIFSLSRPKAQAQWMGAFGFSDLQIPPTRALSEKCDALFGFKSALKQKVRACSDSF